MSERLEENNEKLISMCDFVETVRGEALYIPLIQRNYKWKAEGTGISATKLIEDIISGIGKGQSKKTLGLITLKCNEDGRVQVLDGQQRLITLTIIMKTLGKLDCWCEFTFQRDEEANSRYGYLFENGINAQELDVGRMELNEKAIRGKIAEGGIATDEIANFILNNIYLLYRTTKSEALDEFLDINSHKTPFYICDYVKYTLLLQAGEKTEEVLELWAKLSEILYSPENQDMFSMISKNYGAEAKSVKMVLLFCDRYQNSDKDELMGDTQFFHREMKRLRYYYCLLSMMTGESETRGKAILSLFSVLAENIVPLTFFGMITEEAVETNTPYLELLQNLYESCVETPKNFHYMCEGNLSNRSFNGRNPAYQSVDSRLQDYMFARMSECCDILREVKYDQEPPVILAETAKNISQSPSAPSIPTGSVPKNLLELLESSEEIYIPNIQRDYMLGGNEESLSAYLKRMNQEYLLGYRADLEAVFREISSDLDLYALYFQETSDSSVGIVTWLSCNSGSYRDYQAGEFLNHLYGTEGKCYGYANVRRSHLYEILLSKYRQHFPNWIEKPDENTKNRLKYGTFSFPQRGGALLGIPVKNVPVTYNNIHNHTYTSSCIMGARSGSKFAVYDGQQRLVTFVLLSAYLIKLELEHQPEEPRKQQLEIYQNLLKKFRFFQRKNANDCLDLLLDHHCPTTELKEKMAEIVVDHTTHAIFQFFCFFREENFRYWSVFGMAGGTPYEKYEAKAFFSVDFMMKHMTFDLIVMKEIGEAEQLFVDMNSGVHLEPYEIYKAKSNHIITEITGNTHWAKAVDNHWVNYFYRISAENGEKKLKDAEVTTINAIQKCLFMAFFEQEQYENQSDDEILEALKKLDPEKAKAILRRGKYVMDVIVDFSSVEEEKQGFVAEFQKFFEADSKNREEFILKWIDITAFLRHFRDDPNLQEIAQKNGISYKDNPELLVLGKRRYFTLESYYSFLSTYLKKHGWCKDVWWYPILSQHLTYCQEGYVENNPEKREKITEERQEEEKSTGEKHYQEHLARRFKLYEWEEYEKYESTESDEKGKTVEPEEFYNGYLLPLGYVQEKNAFFSVVEQAPAYEYTLRNEDIKTPREELVQKILQANYQEVNPVTVNQMRKQWTESVEIASNLAECGEDNYQWYWHFVFKKVLEENGVENFDDYSVILEAVKKIHEKTPQKLSKMQYILNNFYNLFGEFQKETPVFPNTISPKEFQHAMSQTEHKLYHLIAQERTLQNYNLSEMVNVEEWYVPKPEEIGTVNRLVLENLMPKPELQNIESLLVFKHFNLTNPEVKKILEDYIARYFFLVEVEMLWGFRSIPLLSMIFLHQNEALRKKTFEFYYTQKDRSNLSSQHQAQYRRCFLPEDYENNLAVSGMAEEYQAYRNKFLHNQEDKNHGN